MDQLRELKKKWELKLKESGFKDIETSLGRLKQPNTRTIAFENRDLILDFFLKLDHYLSSDNSRRIPDRDRLILELFSQGKKLRDIAQQIQASESTVRNTVRVYKTVIISLE
jgi:DNA-binding NarL/FixJ family response regulator